MFHVKHFLYNCSYMSGLYENILRNSCADLGIALSQDQCSRLIEYMNKILDINTKINLTRIVDPMEFIEKHLIDSLLALEYMPDEKTKVIDVGTGGGFPGVPVAIMRPLSHVVLLDATAKKLKVVDTIVEEIGLKNVLCVHARAEVASTLPAYREKYKYALSRAVAPMPILAELCLPFVEPGGEFIALKGKNYEPELEQAREIIAKLGGEITNVEKIVTEPSLTTRVFIEVVKKEKTKSLYPRSFSEIKKNYKKL